MLIIIQALADCNRREAELQIRLQNKEREVEVLSRDTDHVLEDISMTLCQLCTHHVRHHSHNT